MLYNKKLIVFLYCLITVVITHAAEKKIDLYGKQVILIVADLKQVMFLTKSQIVVNSSYECNIIDLETNKRYLLEENDNRSAREFLMLHGTKIIADIGKGVMLYDTETKTKTYVKKRILDITAQPNSNIIYLEALADDYPKSTEGYTIQYNCKNQESKNLTFSDDSSHRRINPKEDIICSTGTGNISFFQLHNLDKPIKTISFGDKTSCCFCQYNCDGSYVAAGDIVQIHIVNPEQGENIASLYSQENEHFKCIAFHPDGIHLALLTNQFNKHRCTKSIIKYFNVQTKNYIDSMETGGCYSEDFSFSEDGLNVVVGTSNQCTILTVPFAIQNIGQLR